MENSSSTATLPNSASIQKIRKVSYNPFKMSFCFHIVNYHSLITIAIFEL